MIKKNIFVVTFLFCVFGSLFSQNLKVASYNIRYANKHDSIEGNGWGQRLPIISNIIKFYDFDIWGAQEVLNGQLNDLLANLPDYSYVGVGRDDGKDKGEYAPIFFKEKRFKVLKSGHFWLSEDTTYPNKGWDAVLPRICTWVQLRDKQKKKNVWFFNLHMDHVGVKARSESSKLVISKIKEMCNADDAILTGDFNVDQTHDSYNVIANSGVLKDSFHDAKVCYHTNGTFNSFRIELNTDSRIDHIFVSKRMKVNKYAVLTDAYWTKKSNKEKIKSGDSPREISFEEYDVRLPSDHYPIVVELDYP